MGFSETGDDVAHLLRAKNTELHALEAQMLSLPKQARKPLQSEAALLDSQIRRLKDDFTRNMELEKAVAALNFNASAESPGNVALHMETLARLSHGGSESTAEEETALFFLIGCHEVIMTLMGEHKDHAGVLKAGCRCICNLFAGTVLLENGDYITKSLVTGGVGEVIAESMRMHLDNHDIQHYACRVITILAVNTKRWLENNVEEADFQYHAVWAASARVAVGMARRRHAQSTLVTQWADQAMTYL